MPGPRLSRKRLPAVQWRAAHVRPLQGGVPDAPRADAGIRPYKAHKKSRRRFLCSVCYAVAYCPAGSVNTNRHQLPSSLSAWIWPPERLTKILQICSPSPLPRVFMPRERSSL